MLLARALIRRPTLLVLDEPTAAMDADGERDFIHAVDALTAANKTTVLFVTHDVPLAQRFCQHAAWFHKQQVQCGPIDAILDAVRLQEAVQ